MRREDKMRRGDKEIIGDKIRKGGGGQTRERR